MEEYYLYIGSTLVDTCYAENIEHATAIFATKGWIITTDILIF